MFFGEGSSCSPSRSWAPVFPLAHRRNWRRSRSGAESGGKKARTNSLARTADRVCHRRRRRCALLRALLYPVDSASCPPGCTLPCRFVEREDSTPLLVAAASIIYIWLTITVIAFFISHRLALLARSGPLQSGSYLAGTFCSERPDFCLGSQSKNLSRRATTPCLALHLVVSINRFCLRRSHSRPRYHRPYCAGIVGLARTGLCQTSTRLHCRPLLRTRRLISGETFPLSGSAYRAAISAGRADRRRRHLPKA